MASIATAALITAAVGTGIAGYGAYAQGDAASKAASYNASIENMNAALSSQNTVIAEQAGQAQTGMQGQKTRATVGSIAASQAASGIEVGSGSALDVRFSARELGELDALTIRSNAAREAYGYRNQAVSHESQGTLSGFEAKNARIAGEVNAAATLLGGASSAGSNYADYQLKSSGMSGS